MQKERKRKKTGQGQELRQQKETARDWKPAKKHGQRQSERVKRRETGRSSKAKGKKEEKDRTGTGTETTKGNGKGLETSEKARTAAE